MSIFSVSVQVQALLIIFMSDVADHEIYCKTFLLVFAFVRKILTMLFLEIVSQVYLLGALLTIIANACFGDSSLIMRQGCCLQSCHRRRYSYIATAS